MGHTKDLWFADRKMPDGSVKRVPTSRNGTGKRWAASWIDPQGIERSKSFSTKTPADRYWVKMEADRDRGEYVDPKSGQELVSALGKQWLDSLSVDPASKERYTQGWKLHVEPEFGKRKVRSMNRPSEVQAFLSRLSQTYGDSTVGLARMVLGAVLELAVADGDLKKNPVRNRIVSTAKRPVEKAHAWSDDTMLTVIDAHPDLLRALPILGSTLGMREGELYGFAEEDIDYEKSIVHVRRQIKKLDGVWCFALPKSDAERVVPLASYTAQVLKAHIKQYPPVAVSLPWEKPDGQKRTHRLLFTHLDTGEHLRANTYRRWWQPALEAAGVIGPREKRKGGGTQYRTTNKHGRHQMRHYFAAIQLAGGTSITALASYLGHTDPGFTLRVYGHFQPDSHEQARKVVDARFFRPRSVKANHDGSFTITNVVPPERPELESDGTGTEQG